MLFCESFCIQFYGWSLFSKINFFFWTGRPFPASAHEMYRSYQLTISLSGVRKKSWYCTWANCWQSVSKTPHRGKRENYHLMLPLSNKTIINEYHMATSHTHCLRSLHRPLWSCLGSWTHYIYDSTWRIDILHKYTCTIKVSRCPPLLTLFR